MAQSQLTCKLLEVARSGTLEDIRSAFHRNTPGKEMKVSRDTDGRTALHLACLYNSSTDVAMFLVEHGFDIGAQDNLKATPLMFAAKTGLVEIIEYAVEKAKSYDKLSNQKSGPNIARDALCKRDIQNSVLLHYCFDGGSRCSEKLQKSPYNKQKILQLLWESDLNLDHNKKDHCGKTPLELTMHCKEYQASTAYLLSKKAKLPNQTILHFKINFPADENDIISKYLEFARIDERDTNQATPLHNCAEILFPSTKTTVDLQVDGSNTMNEGRQKFRIKCAKALLKAKVDVNAINITGRTPLQIAYELQFDEMIELLLMNGGQVRVLHGDYGGIMHLESCRLWSLDGPNKCESRHMYLIKRFNLNVDEKDTADRTPLHYACIPETVGLFSPDLYFSMKGRICAVNALLDQNADINAQDDQGETPLMYAVKSKQVEIVSLLVKRGANTVIKNKVSLSAFNLADGLGDEAKQFLNILNEKIENTQVEDELYHCKKSISHVKGLLLNYNITDDLHVQEEAIHSLEEAEKHLSRIMKDSRMKKLTELQRDIFKRMRGVLCEEIYPQNVFNRLRQKGLLTEDQQEEICAIPTRRKRMEKLLDILPRQGPGALPGLIEALREDCLQHYLADELEAEYSIL